MFKISQNESASMYGDTSAMRTPRDLSVPLALSATLEERTFVPLVEKVCELLL